MSRNKNGSNTPFVAEHQEQGPGQLPLLPQRQELYPQGAPRQAASTPSQSSPPRRIGLDMQRGFGPVSQDQPATTPSQPSPLQRQGWDAQQRPCPSPNHPTPTSSSRRREGLDFQPGFFPSFPLPPPPATSQSYRPRRPESEVRQWASSHILQRNALSRSRPSPSRRPESEIQQWMSSQLFQQSALTPARSSPPPRQGPELRRSALSSTQRPARAPSPPPRGASCPGAVSCPRGSTSTYLSDGHWVTDDPSSEFHTLVFTPPSPSSSSHQGQ